MVNRKKAGGLLLILAVPLLILVFLELFGKQHYAIPTDPAEAEGLSAEVPAGALGKQFAFSVPLLTVEREAVSEDSFLGEVLVVYYAPAANSDTAQLILEKLTRVQDVFEQDTLVRLLTVVPTTKLDSLSRLAQQYRVQSAGWKFLADTTQEYLSAQRLPPPSNASTLLLVDQAQSVRGYYDGAQEKEIDRLVAETRILRYGVK